jgi:hypothetical protein
MNESKNEPVWDAFVSYASEDRAKVARPLVEALRALGLRIWFDQTELRVGDSLRERIDAGLATKSLWHRGTISSLFQQALSDT